MSKTKFSLNRAFLRQKYRIKSPAWVVPSLNAYSSVPDLKLIISDPDPQIENQEFRIPIRIRTRILDPDPSVN